jgi:RNA polymerase sigma factor (sigma-70 family)
VDRWTRRSSPASSDAGAPAGPHLPATPAAVAFEEFFETERRQLFRAIYLMTGSIHDAEELTQDAFLTVWARWERVRRMDSPTGYLYRTAMNAYRSRHRRLARLARRSLLPSPAEDPFEASDLRESIIRALREIAPRQRAALILTELLDYDSEEAGRLLGVKAVTVRNLASQGRAQLKRSIEPRDG